MKNRPSRINLAHYLNGSRLDNWLHLLWQNRFRIRRDKLPQALFITLMSVLTAPFALLEALVMAIPLRVYRLRQDPVYILGAWRSGTTFLQNTMSRDHQFGWANPINASLHPVCLSLGWLLKPLMNGVLRDARPMDNLHYRVDLPMEDTFALVTVSTWSIIHMIAFPRQFQRYFSGTFVDDLKPREIRRWKQIYGTIIKKISLTQGGRLLLLKSPDNTGHLRQIMELFPRARYINIYREPYVTIQSMIHMFHKQMERLCLTELPEGDVEELMEDYILRVYERMYRELFAIEKTLPPERYISVRYEDFTARPEYWLEKIYTQLGLDGFQEALPRFQAYLDSQKDYQKNHFVLSDRLREKINARMGFYFAHYGYTMQEEGEA